MTTEDLLNTGKMEQYQTHLCLVSTQAAANFHPVVSFRPKNVVLFVTKQMVKAADELEQSLRKASPDTKCERVNVPDAIDVNTIMELVWESLAKYEDASPIVNVTGGTKPMAMAAMMAAASMDMPAFYLDQEKSSITLFPAWQLDRNTRLATVDMKPKMMQHYLAAYGYSTDSLTVRTASLSALERQLAQDLVMNRDMRRVLPMLNKLAVGAEKTLRTTGFAAALQQDRSGCLDRLVANFEDLGRVHRKNGELEFDFEEDRFFTAGGWLERYVAAIAAEMGLSPWSNIEVKKDVTNEIDVAFYNSSHFYIIECKTSFLQNNDEASKVVYKLKSLKEIGGANTKLILVSCQEVNKYARERARSSGIDVIDGDKLANLKNALKTILTSNSSH